MKNAKLSIYEGTLLNQLREESNQNMAKSSEQSLTNILIAKKCQFCNTSMYVHKKEETVIFSGCEPCIVDIQLEKTGDDEILVKGKRSQKVVRCHTCKRRHLLKSFEEVKDGVSKA